ncbi:hypothetical protein [Pseudotamlana carrageenivorans]|uniref:RiboL-PSP-HEPN domain-containing protein n=1 Tax=Pseudotamlana carrageenivorans TaxID=2069432 RepID=A0A2I7SKD8_9FLAO|nr:hypothetical protein [Tamlana carrageenivorans]AUS06376.1 hypothetical protein C1A40_13390 [Tamlana carrageenivorans]
MTNPLKKEIDDFLNKIALYESLHYQTKVHLSNTIKQIEKKNESNSGIEPFIGTKLIIGDLTGKSANGWKLNYPTEFQIEIKGQEEMIKSIDTLISQNGMTFLANCYEILESFLFNIIGEFLNVYPTYQKHLKVKKELLTDQKEFLRKYYRSKNNTALLKLLREISPNYKESENLNNTDINLNDWYYVITNVRHSIVHSLHLLDTKKLNFSKNQMFIYKTFFSHEEIQGSWKLIMTYEETKKQINLIAEFGFMIFKSLSNEQNEDRKILHNLK